MSAGAALLPPGGGAEGVALRPGAAAEPLFRLRGAELSRGTAAVELEPEPDPGGRRGAEGRGGSCSPPGSPPTATMRSDPLAHSASLLEEATDLLVLHRDFAAALGRCEAGCDSLGPATGPESSAEVKCSLCVVGIQALAEMNRWREVLSWVLQYYHVPEHLPPKVLELCILLYSKVRDPQVMLEVGSSWLTDQTNKSLPEYSSLLELYLLHVLLPLGRFEGAEELVRGCGVFDSQQQLAFLGTICESRCQWAQQEEMHLAAEEQQDAATETVLGALSQKLLTMLTLLRRALRSMSSHFYLFPYKKMLLATFLLYLVVVRLDPGLQFKTRCLPSQNVFFSASVKVSACLEDVIGLALQGLLKSMS
ncbi:peroxisome assembly protein 26 isoform X2 [Lathamus discolor]|uniref:peroxisome assembly protein 26 isoform X2 n=1 Tax=Lathamus discolor TaxID=678569 RepID=UPI0032B753F9